MIIVSAMTRHVSAMAATATIQREHGMLCEKSESRMAVQMQCVAIFSRFLGFKPEGMPVPCWKLMSFDIR